jgi:hypothetical protein
METNNLTIFDSFEDANFSFFQAFVGKTHD